MASDASALPERDPGPAAMPRIPGYRLERRLGQGGMAVVYLATQHSLEREVAIKVMAPSASSDEAQAQRFEHEARIIAKLEHPSIVGIHEVGRTAEGQLYYVMPYLARGDLSQRDYRHEEGRIIELLRQLLDALGYAHARGIVHRDVKAENVLFNNADRPQLTDFGIALARGRGKARITTDGLALGSGGYMSPEQARGEPVDGRADLYSLGVLTYELLTGRLPYEAEDPLALALMHASDPVPRLPPEKAHWQGFIDTAMAKSPDKRFRNAQVMARALDPIARRLQPRRWRSAAAALAPWRRPAALVAIGTGLALALGIAVLPRLRDAVPAAPATDPAAGTDVIPPAAVLPTPEERQAQHLLRLQQAQAQFAAGNLIAPAGANAAEGFLAVLREDPTNDAARDGVDRVLAALGARVVEHVAKERREAAQQSFEEARLLAESAQWQDTPVWAAQRDRVRGAIVQRAQAALDAFDRTAVPAWADLAEHLGLGDATTRALRERAALLPQPGSVLRDGSGPELAFIPAQVGNARLDHAFAMMRNEVTRGEYAQFAAASGRSGARCRNRFSPLQLLDGKAWNDPGFEQGGNHPVVCVGFEDARAYAAWLSRRSGKTYRLPTLQEWRHASQYLAGTVTCADGNVLDRGGGGKSAQACSDGARHTRAVRGYRASAWGLFDLVGNASEWTLSCGEAGNRLARLLERDACPRRAAAGLSWRDGRQASAAQVQMLDPERGYDDVGFRLVREL